MTPLALFAGVFLLAWSFARLYLRLASGRVVDMPGQRSSHAQPTPTGGGIGLVAALAIGAAFVPGIGSDWQLVIALAAALAAVGFLDDLRSLPVLPRLLAQAAAAIVLVLAGGTGWVNLAVPAGLAGGALLAIALVWCVNAFNFMDGIDGLAAAHALFMAGAAALLAHEAGSDTSGVMLCIAAAAGGFLVLNWQPARLFMGDAGSLALGFLLAASVPVTAGRGEIAPLVWLVLWAPLLCDTGLTLLQRAWRREALHQAHRGHAYQRLARAWGGHARVVLVLVLIDLAWLLPMAVAIQHDADGAPLLAGIALLPLLAGCAHALIRHRA